jgi:hypothetical protein
MEKSPRYCTPYSWQDACLVGSLNCASRMRHLISLTTLFIIRKEDLKWERLIWIFIQNLKYLGQ